MSRKITTKAAFILLSTVSSCFAGGCAEDLSAQQPAGVPAQASAEKIEPNSVEQVLQQLKQKTEELKSYQSEIEYLISQPLFKSKSLRKGVLYYQKGEGKSALRINFETLKQDDDKQQKYIEQYIFDGVWLTHIDYQSEQVKRYQQAEPNEPVNAFELVKRNFPIIGFTKVEELKKEFEIKLVEQERAGRGEFIQLHLKVKPDSIYKDDYTSIDFWIDEKLGLPAKIVVVSTEPAEEEQKDTFEIKFLKPKVNKKIDEKVFEFEIPEDFTVEVEPLEKED